MVSKVLDPLSNPGWSRFQKHYGETLTWRCPWAECRHGNISVLGTTDSARCIVCGRDPNNAHLQRSKPPLAASRGEPVYWEGCQGCGMPKDVCYWDLRENVEQREQFGTCRRKGCYHGVVENYDGSQLCRFHREDDWWMPTEMTYQNRQGYWRTDQPHCSLWSKVTPGRTLKFKSAGSDEYGNRISDDSRSSRGRSSDSRYPDDDDYKRSRRW